MSPPGGNADLQALRSKARAQGRRLAALQQIPLTPWYTPGAGSLLLGCLVVAEPDGSTWLLAHDHPGALPSGDTAMDMSLPELQQLARGLGRPLLPLHGAWRLDQVQISKPWGSELWYSGMEVRGVNAVADPEHPACVLPLPWALALAPLLTCGGQPEQVVLLKILAPHPEPVFGDLYFELHDQKREVYVVTHVDSDAWPDGRGAIRFGMDQNRRQASSSDASFRRNYAAAVAAYEPVRRQLDRALDQQRSARGIGLDQPLAPDQLKALLASLGPGITPLLQQEQQLRQAMDAFTNMAELAVGDVVQVPPGLPHSLQHGVRVVEFQTQTYERRILSFAQKVLTQDHWDTDSAVRDMSLDNPALANLDSLPASPGAVLDRIANFDHFQVLRVQLSAGASWTLPAAPYRLAMGIAGNSQLGALTLGPEQAAFVPGSADLQLRADAAAGCTTLLALPGPAA